MWPSQIVVDAPCLDGLAGMAIGGEHVLIQALVTEPADEALGEGVLHGLAWRDEVPLDALLPPRLAARLALLNMAVATTYSFAFFGFFASRFPRLLLPFDTSFPF